MSNTFFQGGKKFSRRGFAPLVTGLMVTPQSQNVHNFHKNGLISSHQSVGRWLIFYMFCSKDILTKLVGYHQPICLWVKMEFVVGTISLSYDLSLVELFSLMWGRHNCVRKIVFRFTYTVLWKLHG